MLTLANYIVLSGERRQRCSRLVSTGKRLNSHTFALAQTLVQNNVVVVVAAGNDARDASGYSPASAPEAITVGSTTSSDTMSSFSK